MTCLDLTLPTPAENLACDEALLDYCEGGGANGWLRFWEARSHFVVVGYGNSVATEVNLPACQRAGVPVLRRCSGGGTVLQGPGCLNYALILRIDDGPLQSVAAANRFILEKNRSAVESLLKATPVTLRAPVELRGQTDLALGDLKFSGNAQRRRKHFLLFHGTFLLQFDISLVAKFLPSPARQPDYRLGRAHGDFLINLEVPAAGVKQSLRETWSAHEEPSAVPLECVSSLARDRYESPEWNFRF